MPRSLLSGGSSGMSAGGWVGIGIAIGFFIGAATVLALNLFLRRRSSANKQPPPQRAHARAAPAADVYASHSAMDMQPAPLYASQGEPYYSPLQSSMVKSRKSGVAVRNSNNVCLSPDATAALGGHGSAVLHITRPPTHGAPIASLAGQFSTAATPTRPTPTQPSSYYPVPTPATASSFAPSQAAGAQVPQGPPAPSPSQAQPVHERMASVAEAYADEDLDAEWAVVFGDLDELLAKRGQPILAPPERAVAVKTLIRLTGTRGMQAALEETLQEVLRFRGSGR